MKPIRLWMINEEIRSCPLAPLKEGFNLRPWQIGDTQVWAEIITQAGEASHLQAALTRFTAEFSGLEQLLQSRCLILQTRDGQPIGTAMGWLNKEFGDGTYGRLHWVSIIPEYQGLGLARPLVTHAIERMKSDHTKAYLKTQTTSYKGIKLYLDYGFRPFMQSEDCLEGWEIVSRVLKQDLI